MSAESELLTATDSGIQTVITAIASPQVVYLDFDGAETSYYNRDLDISVSNISVEDSGFDSATISVIVASLNEQFGDDVFFTAELPDDAQFSTNLSMSWIGTLFFCASTLIRLMLEYYSQKASEVTT